MFHECLKWHKNSSDRMIYLCMNMNMFSVCTAKQSIFSLFFLGKWNSLHRRNSPRKNSACIHWVFLFRSWFVHLLSTRHYLAIMFANASKPFNECTWNMYSILLKIHWIDRCRHCADTHQRTVTSRAAHQPQPWWRWRWRRRRWRR